MSPYLKLLCGIIHPDTSRLTSGLRTQELKTAQDLDKFVHSQPDTVLTVVNVSSSNATACVRVFAAIAALAKSFKGYAAFARLLYDTSDELTQLARDLRVVEVTATLLAFPSSLWCLKRRCSSWHASNEIMMTCKAYSL